MLLNHPSVRLSWTSTFRSIRKVPPVCTRLFSVSVPRYTVEMATVNTSERLSKLRQLMLEHKVDVYSMASHPWLASACIGSFFCVCVDTDCCEKLSPRKIATSQNTLRRAMLVEVRLSLLHFHSCNPLACGFRLSPLTPILAEFISGFTGSAGTAIVSTAKAALSTDGRYFNQASQQLDDNWTLLKRGVEGVPTWQEWYSTSVW